jgi:hypothetical protein
MKEKKKRRKAESRKQKAECKKLKAEDRLQEWKRVGYFFEWFGDDGAKQRLWEILKLALVADNDSADERLRSNMIFFYEQATEFFKITSDLWERKRKKMTREEIMDI